MAGINAIADAEIRRYNLFLSGILINTGKIASIKEIAITMPPISNGKLLDTTAGGGTGDVTVEFVTVNLYVTEGLGSSPVAAIEILYVPGDVFLLTVIVIVPVYVGSPPELENATFTPDGKPVAPIVVPHVLPLTSLTVYPVDIDPPPSRRTCCRI